MRLSIIKASVDKIPNLAAFHVAITVWSVLVTIAIAHLTILLILNFKRVEISPLPLHKLRKNWETWLALPSIAFLLSILSGVSATWLLDKDKFQMGVNLALAGLGTIGLVANYFGRSDFSRPDDLSRIKSPHLLLVELKFQTRDHRLDDIQLSHAQAAIDDLKLQGDPLWLREIRESLEGNYELSHQQPTLGLWHWKDTHNLVVMFSAQHLLSGATLTALFNWPYFLAEGLLLVALAKLPPEVLFRLHWQSLKVWLLILALFAITIFLNYCAIRGNLILKLRRQVFERDVLAQIERIMESSRDYNSKHQKQPPLLVEIARLVLSWLNRPHTKN